MKNKDPRSSGLRLSFVGGIIFFVGWLVPFTSGMLNAGAVPSIIRTIFTTIAILGFFIAIVGMGKHYKTFFGPIDPKREVDPGYDFEYLLCPHCKKAKMRIEASVVKCPVCKKKTRTKE
jgi:hypothetical protein